MANKRREKQIEKRIIGLEKQRQKHLEKIETLEGRKDTTRDYWRKEVARLDDEIEDLEEELEERQ